MKKCTLLLLLCLSSSSFAHLTYTVAGQSNGFEKVTGSLLSKHAVYLYNDTPQVQVYYITFRSCAQQQKKCAKAIYTKSVYPGATLTFGHDFTNNVVYKFSGHYEFTATTEIAGYPSADSSAVGSIDIYPIHH